MWKTIRTSTQTIPTILAMACIALAMSSMQELIHSLLSKMDEKDRRYEHLTSTLLNVPAERPDPSPPTTSKNEPPTYYERDVPLGELPIDQDILREMAEAGTLHMRASEKDYPGVEQKIPGLLNWTMQETMNDGGSPST